MDPDQTAELIGVLRRIAVAVERVAANYATLEEMRANGYPSAKGTPK